MKKIEKTEITGWHVASKTRPIKAKPLITLLVDRKVTNKFLVDTLEGKEPLGDGSIICVGEAGDTWQQTQKKLLAKYDVKAIDEDGWMVCEPRPENAVDCIEVWPHIFAEQQRTPGFNPDTEFYIIGQWGGEINGEANAQSGVAGDFICRNREDHDDCWIVKRKLFLNTYTIKS